jgi:hypothetical protein
MAGGALHHIAAVLDKRVEIRFVSSKSKRAA